MRYNIVDIALFCIVDFAVSDTHTYNATNTFIALTFTLPFAILMDPTTSAHRPANHNKAVIVMIVGLLICFCCGYGMLLLLVSDTTPLWSCVAIMYRCLPYIWAAVWPPHCSWSVKMCNIQWAAAHGVFNAMCECVSRTYEDAISHTVSTYLFGGIRVATYGDCSTACPRECHKRVRLKLLMKLLGK